MSKVSTFEVRESFHRFQELIWPSGGQILVSREISVETSNVLLRPHSKETFQGWPVLIAMLVQAFTLKGLGRTIRADESIGTGCTTTCQLFRSILDCIR